MAGLNSKTSKSTTTTTSRMEETKTERPPKGAKITRQSIRTETEEIENGFITSKNYDGSWEDSKGNSHYFYFSKKWYTKEDPLTITINDKELADEFDEE